MKRSFMLVLITLVTALALLPGEGAAQAPRNITLKEVIDLTVKNSKQLKNNRAQVLEAIAATPAPSSCKVRARLSIRHCY